MRQVTTSSDKEKYGLRLKAVADYQILGKRLKGDFKTVLNALEGFSYLILFQQTIFLDVAASYLLLWLLFNSVNLLFIIRMFIPSFICFINSLKSSFRRLSTQLFIHSIPYSINQSINQPFTVSALSQIFKVSHVVSLSNSSPFHVISFHKFIYCW